MRGGVQCGTSACYHQPPYRRRRDGAREEGVRDALSGLVAPCEVDTREVVGRGEELVQGVPCGEDQGGLAELVPGVVAPVEHVVNV